MDDNYVSPASHFAEFNRRTFFGILFIASISALITLIAAKLLNEYIVSPALCGSAGEAVCNNSTSVSFHISSVLAAIVAVAMLVNLSVYRPLLVAMAILAGTWGMYNLPFPLINTPWYWQLGTIFLVNALAMLVFAWILRAYNFVAGIILTLLITGAMIAAIYL